MSKKLSQRIISTSDDIFAKIMDSRYVSQFLMKGIPDDKRIVWNIIKSTEYMGKTWGESSMKALMTNLEKDSDKNIIKTLFENFALKSIEIENEVKSTFGTIDEDFESKPKNPLLIKYCREITNLANSSLMHASFPELLAALLADSVLKSKIVSNINYRKQNKSEFIDNKNYKYFGYEGMGFEELTEFLSKRIDETEKNVDQEIENRLKSIFQSSVECKFELMETYLNP